MAGDAVHGDRGGGAPSRPRVVCHMVASTEGRIVVHGWPLPQGTRDEYERVHASYDSEGWLCGRVTMEAFAGGVRSEDDVAREHDGAPRDDFRAPVDAAGFALAVDPSGRLAWRENEIDGDHVVAILTQRVCA